MCSRHYQRTVKHGTPMPSGVQERVHRSGLCNVEHCTLALKAHGYCQKHYQRWQKYGDPGEERDPAQPRLCVVCAIDISHRKSNALTCSTSCKATAADRRRNARPSATLRKEDRRARLLGNAGYIGVTDWEWARIRNQYRGCCAYCGKWTPRPDMDHVVPLARGGRHAPANIVPACSSCNLSKFEFFVIEWKLRQRKGRPVETSNTSGSCR